MKAGWVEKSVGEVCRVVAGQSPKASFYNEQGQGLPFYQGKKEFTDRLLGSPTTWTTSVTKEAVPGDIVMSVRAPVGPINEATQRICIGRGLAAIRASAEIVRGYLWYALLWLQPKIRGNAGAVFDSINKSGIEALKIPLPPLEEQQRIVAILDEAFEGLDRARENVEASLLGSSDLYQLALMRVFTQQGEDWRRTTIGEICTIKSGTTVPKSEELARGSIPYVKVGDMNIADNVDGIITSSRFLDRKTVKPNKVIPAGTTIFPKRGGAIMTNKKRKVLVEICADLNVMGVIPGPKIDSEFLYQFFLSVDMKDIGSGSAIPQINNYDISPLAISLPADVKAQRDIANYLTKLSEQCQTLSRSYQLQLDDLDHLRQSLLDKAFAGELT